MVASKNTKVNRLTHLAGRFYGAVKLFQQLRVSTFLKAHIVYTFIGVEVNEGDVDCLSSKQGRLENGRGGLWFNHFCFVGTQKVSLIRRHS